jgi:hypothetical protein
VDDKEISPINRLTAVAWIECVVMLCGLERCAYLRLGCQHRCRSREMMFRPLCGWVYFQCMAKGRYHGPIEGFERQAAYPAASLV